MRAEGFPKAGDSERCSEATLLLQATWGFRTPQLWLKRIYKIEILGDAIISLLNHANIRYPLL